MAARERGRGRCRGRGANAPITVEEVMRTQNEMIHAFMQHLQHQPTPPPPSPPVHVRDKRGEFMNGRPPVFTQSTDPMEADDLLRAVEKQLNIAQCNDLEKGVVCFRTAAWGSSDMVGVFSSCSSQPCSCCHLARILQRF